MITGGNATVQPVPKLCTYGIQIKEISCGDEHSAFITIENYLYCMGSNAYGQLGIGDPTVKFKNSPVLVDSFLNNQMVPGILSVACGFSHTVACTTIGTVYTWGQGEFGALGVQGVRQA